MRYSVDLTQDRIMQKRIEKALRDKVNELLGKTAKTIGQRIGHLIVQVIENTREYRELDDGILAAHFGLADGKRRIDNILQIWANNVQVQVKRARVAGTGIRASLEVRAIRADYADVLSTEEAMVLSANGGKLPWLSWLLEEGDRTIIISHDIIIGDFPSSRSGDAIMTPSPARKWSVPAPFSGTRDDNMITRAIAANKDAFLNALQIELMRSL